MALWFNLEWQLTLFSLCFFRITRNHLALVLMNSLSRFIAGMRFLPSVEMTDTSPSLSHQPSSGCHPNHCVSFQPLRVIPTTACHPDHCLSSRPLPVISIRFCHLDRRERSHHPSLRSFHPGLTATTRVFFFSRRHFLISFSLDIAAPISSVSSK